MFFGQLFVLLSPNNSHIVLLHLSFLIKLVLFFFMNKSFEYNESKKLSPEAQKQRVLFLEKLNITSPPSDVADPKPHHFG